MLRSKTNIAALLLFSGLIYWLYRKQLLGIVGWSLLVVWAISTICLLLAVICMYAKEYICDNKEDNDNIPDFL